MSQALVAALFSFVVVLFIGPASIRYLHRLKYGQQVRIDGPQSHLEKTGTPTMGGVFIILAMAITSLIFAPDRPLILYALLPTLGFALIGFADDFISIAAKRSLGLPARYKLLGQVVIALVPTMYAITEGNVALSIPFSAATVTLPPIVFAVFSVFIIVGFSNALNITDGLDGLLSGSTTISLLAYGVVTASLGHDGLTIFIAAIAGATLGFTWFNAHPAQVFMGDTGSLALGAAFGTIAVLSGTHFLAVIIGGLFVMETVSVMLQVTYFRLTKGKRIFKMSPIHHHFELVGWAEPKVVIRFWLIAVVCGILGVMAL